MIVIYLNKVNGKVRMGIVWILVFATGCHLDGQKTVWTFSLGGKCNYERINGGARGISRRDIRGLRGFAVRRFAWRVALRRGAARNGAAWAGGV